MPITVNPQLRITPYADGRGGRWVYELADPHGRDQRLLLGDDLHQAIEALRADHHDSSMAGHPAALERLLKLKILLADATHTVQAPTQPKRAAYLSLAWQLLAPAQVRWLAAPLRWLFHPLSFLVGALIGLVALLALPILLQSFDQWQPLRSVDVLLTLSLGLFGVFLHELGHAAAALRHGARQVSLGVGWYVCFPVAYADLSEIWTMPRAARIQIDLAGVYMQGLLLGALLSWHLYSGAGWPLFVAGATATSMLWNLNPLLRMDGYWLLCDWFGQPALRTSAVRAALDLVRRALGRSPTATAPTSGWILFYGVICGLFMIYLLVAAAWFIHQAADAVLPDYVDRLRQVPLSWSSWADLLVIGGALAWKLMMVFLLGRLLIKRGAQGARWLLAWPSSRPLP